jgi:hypothetical protein
VDAITGVSGGNGLGMVNRIINPGMVIDQRNAGANVTITNTAANTYTLDRWSGYGSQASKYSIQQNAGSVTPPAGFTNYLGVTSLSAYSIGSGDIFQLRQIIEGFNIADFAWGTASASAVTLSFKVYSSLTGTFGGSLQNSAETRCYPFTYTISAANTWTTINITIPGDTTGTWLTNNGAGIKLNLGLGVGSTYSGTAGAWAAGAYYSATGATSVVGTNGATFYITGVDLRKGTFTSTPAWDYRPYGTELALCQRYYQTGGVYGWPRSSDNVSIASAYLPASMRTVPTYTLADGAVQSAGPDTRTIQSFGAYKTGTSASTSWSTTFTASAEL